MKFRLSITHADTVHPRDMQFGDVGEIVGHPMSCYVGMLVVASQVGLMQIGGRAFWVNIQSLVDDFRIRLLQPGETITVEE